VDLRQVAVASSLEAAIADPSLAVNVYVAKLLVALGLKSSRAEAERQVTAGVNIDGVTTTEKVLVIQKRPARIAVRVGKQARIAVII
jgi:tyrosyl-tRNA synthetase